VHVVPLGVEAIAGSSRACGDRRFRPSPWRTDMVRAREPGAPRKFRAFFSQGRCLAISVGARNWKNIFSWKEKSLKPRALLAIQLWRRWRAAIKQQRAPAPEDCEVIDRAMDAAERGESFWRALGLPDNWRSAMFKAQRDELLREMAARIEGDTAAKIRAVRRRHGLSANTVRRVLDAQKSPEVLENEACEG
jgi:hypothetical protein